MAILSQQSTESSTGSDPSNSGLTPRLQGDAPASVCTILLVDDNAVIRRGLRMMLDLRRNLKVVGEAADGETALLLARDLKPDIIIMETALPLLDGITAMQRLQTSAPHAAIVILTLYDDAATRERALAAGASAFVGKHDSPLLLVEEIYRVSAQLKCPSPVEDKCTEEKQDGKQNKQ